MADSYIEISKGSTCFVGPDATNLVRARVLKSGLIMWTKYKMIPTRGITITRMLTIATEYTGKSYKRTEANRAVDELQSWIAAMECSMPIVKIAP